MTWRRPLSCILQFPGSFPISTIKSDNRPAQNRIIREASPITEYTFLSPSLMSIITRSKVAKPVAHESAQQKALGIGLRGELYPWLTISVLPDDVLLKIFDFYLGIRAYGAMQTWCKLIHVCQRWRYIVLASPRRLHLQLRCTDRKSVKKLLHIWPPFPIHVETLGLRWYSTDNVIAALQQHDRVCRIDLEDAPNTFFNEFGAIKQPFPTLRVLYLRSRDEGPPVLPDSFLGGSAPRLEVISLDGIPYPGIQKLLLSTTALVHLRLCDIPHSGYISPEAMVTALSTLTRLERLYLKFRSPRPWDDRENRHPPLRRSIVLPTLTDFSFHGNDEYLEYIISRVDASQLHDIDISFFNRLVFHTPQLCQFISRAEKLRSPHRADVTFWGQCVSVTLSFSPNSAKQRPRLALRVLCKPMDWQLSSISQLCASTLPRFSTLTYLEIGDHRPPWQDDMIENIQCLEFLQPFTFVKNLAVYCNLVQFVALALEELASESVAELLPALQDIFLSTPRPSEPIKKAIGKFIAARQISGCPVTLQHGSY